MSLKKALNVATFGAVGAIGGKAGKLIRAAVLVVAGAVSGNFQLVAAGLALGASALKKKAKPAHSQERLQATFDLHAPRKMWFGETAGGTDVRYQAYTGADQEYLEQILCVASHECESIDELWFDSKLAWSASGGVTSDFTGYLTVAVRNPGTSGNGIAIDSVWTADCTLTGCAYLHLKYKLTGNSKKAESPFAGGIPSRVTVRGKGAKLPVLSVGGVDIDDQTTWLYEDGGQDHGRNPAWQRLFYLRGWQIGGKLAVGRGIPSSRLNLDEYVDAAAICDESVALDGGGTEKRYRCDHVFSEAEEPAAVLAAINETMNAVPTDENGRIGVYVLHDDLSDPDMVELDESDLGAVPGGSDAQESWVPHLSIEQTHNVIRGHYTDASDAGLYQMREAGELALPGADLGSPDGIQRIDTLDLAAVQSGTQWQRLAKLRQQRELRPGIYSANFRAARAWRARMWRPVRFSHAGIPGFEDGRYFRVIGMTMPTGIAASGAGIIRLTLQQTEAEEFDWDETVDEVAVDPSGAPDPWDWQNDPTLQGPLEGETNLLIASSWTVPSKVLEATEAGGSVTIEVIPHVRHYADGVTVSIAGGDTFPGLDPDEEYAFHYDDFGRSDTTPTIVQSADVADAQPVAGRHTLNRIKTPASGSGATFTGGGAYPPGSTLGVNLQ